MRMIQRMLNGPPFAGQSPRPGSRGNIPGYAARFSLVVELGAAGVTLRNGG
jgi:hypothetical protein